VPGEQPSSARYLAYATTQSGEHIWLRVLALPASNAIGEQRTVHILRAVGSEDLAHDDATIILERPMTATLQGQDQSARGFDGADEQVNPSRKSHVLTRRELEVLKLLAGGLSNANIAAKLSISPVTARNCRRRSVPFRRA